MFGVVIAAVVFLQLRSAPPGTRPPMPFEIGTDWGAPLATKLAATAVFCLLAYTLARLCRSSAD